jgi:hypothetical protein
MNKLVTFNVGDANACSVIPPSADLAPHGDGTIEAIMRIRSAEVDRPAGMGGNLIVRLEGEGTGSVDLILSAEAAEKLALALIRTGALPVGNPLRPSIN